MSFNFNWSPLIADTTRAKEMLTTALNKSPKPPIIVDDIIVSELNLGETPPDLEILEIGDLAEDRFRGIFKMAYSGDAFLTLRTRVQANPLNTYLSTKPEWTSPGPLAAASGLTIPLAITLSDIRLSGFVILVFSKNKGMTLVFRNDPLESLKVSSTFDSIPFVRDYLQREIEKQLRNLFMEDLPAILHRLSLRLWSPEYRELDDLKVLEQEKESAESAPVDPLLSLPQDASEDWQGNGVPSTFFLDPDNYAASFSQKNLLRLATLSDSHRTLSLFTPPVRDAVFRAWAGSSERNASGVQTPIHHTIPTLSRAASYLGSSASTSSVFSDSAASETASRTSTSYTFQGMTSRSIYGGRPRKAKKRVINLRRNNKSETVTADQSDPPTETSTPEPSVAPSSAPSVIYEERAEDSLQTPPRTPLLKNRRHRASSLDETPRASMILASSSSTSSNVPILDRSPPKRMERPPKQHVPEKGKALPQQPLQADEAPPAYTPSSQLMPTTSDQKQSKRTRPPLKLKSQPTAEFDFAIPPLSRSSSDLLRTLSSEKIAGGLGAPFSPSSEGSGGGILEQAWMERMARDLARKVEEERLRRRSGGEKSSAALGEREEGPPAYAV